MSSANENLIAIHMPGVETIGNRAFYYCTKLATITMPKVKTIGNDAFRVCVSLDNINISTVTAIGTSAFRGCNKLTNVIMPSTEPSIGDNAFRQTNFTPNYT